jgi:short subunit dehydrogenase-like uncharacterized protein
MSTAPGRDRELDVILFGATGFVGRLTARYLADAAPAGLRIGLGGRSQARLEAVRAELGATAAGWTLIAADSSDGAAMDALAARTTVVATTVGPYARYGIGLVGACARAGTHYADLTGEVLFVRASINRFHAVAADSGARIVHACGYDSIPSDLAVLLLSQRAGADGAGTLGTTTLVAHARGGVSGGTIDSLRTQVDAVRADAALGRIVADPYALSPDRAAEPDLGDESDPAGIRHDGLVGGWLAPFVMGPYNTRIVRRSNALQDWVYGRSFRYREAMGGGPGPLGAAVAGGLTAAQAGLTAAMGVGPTRLVLDRVLPKPGSGPGATTQRRGYFRTEVHTRTTGGAHYVATFAGDGDPGYAATARMLGQSALCLALDTDALPAAAGVLTPATAMGGKLARRLVAAGFRAYVTAA